MSLLNIIFTYALAYILGSIPSAVWIGKIFHNIDVREHGSGNAGATNTIRVLGWKTGIPVLLIDLIKGWFATMLPVFFHLAEKGTPGMINYQIIAGLVAVAGHIFPVFAGFRGGKGVATVFGSLLALHPLLTISCIGVFLAVLLITGIVSVSSITAGIAFPLFLWFVYGSDSVVFKYFAIFIAIALIVTHRKNIGRLLRGEEKKLIRLGKKKES